MRYEADVQWWHPQDFMPGGEKGLAVAMGCSLLEAAEKPGLVGLVAVEAQRHGVGARASSAASTHALLISLSPFVRTKNDIMVM